MLVYRPDMYSPASKPVPSGGSEALGGERGQAGEEAREEGQTEQAGERRGRKSEPPVLSEN
jgi:hypothetical protein